MGGPAAGPARRRSPASPARRPTDCCTLGTLAGIDCTMPPLTCQGGTCEADVPVSQSTTIDLATDVKPSLAQYSSLASITISSISYAVSNNTLNVDLPPVSIYLAPGGVTDSSDARAVALRYRPADPGRDESQRAGTAGLQLGRGLPDVHLEPLDAVQLHRGDDGEDRRRHPGPERSHHDRRHRNTLRSALRGGVDRDVVIAGAGPAGRRRGGGAGGADPRGPHPLPRQGALPARQALRRRADRARANGAGAARPGGARAARRLRPGAAGLPPPRARRRARAARRRGAPVRVRRRSGGAGARARHRDRDRGGAGVVRGRRRRRAGPDRDDVRAPL